MSRRVNQVEDILLAVLSLIHNAYRLGLDGYASLPLNIHVVKHLCLHLTAGKQSGLLNNTVRKGGLAMVNVGYNTKITNLTLVYGHLIPHF